VSYNPYMNGWNRANSATAPGVCIHHPAGSIKKISTYSSALTSATWTGCLTNGHWRVVWSSNANGWGVTEGGSSGSPIFDANSRIVGTLTGGSSYCSAQSSPDYYGKFYCHWDLNGATSSVRLKDWLDPAGTNPLTLDGKNCSGTSTPVANFVGNPTTVNVGGQVVFTNQSTGTITSYSWSFPGGTPNTATGIGPHTITYNTIGVYDATLTVGTPTNTLTRTNYINVVNGTTTCDTLHYPLAGTPVIYGVASPQSGYVAGNNSYGDLAKADYFATYDAAKKINGTYIYFGVGKGGSSNVPFKVWNNTGTAGAPGTVLATQNVSLTTIKSDVTANQPTYVTFTTPVTIFTPFYVGVTLPTIAGDTVAIFSNTNGDTNPGTAWEQFSDNVWYAFSSTSSWGINVQLAIWPVMCPTGVGISEPQNAPVSIFPNPSVQEIYILLPYPAGEKVNISISDVYGKICKKTIITSSMEGPAKIDLSGLSNGIYILSGESVRGKFVEKISVIK